MCLIVFGLRAHDDYPLVLVANRDEFYARPTAPLAWWPTQPTPANPTAHADALLAGRDLQGGGTWMGVTRSGRFAALTNFRETLRISKSSKPSRGELVAAYLREQQTANQFVDWQQDAANAWHPWCEQYEGFNLLMGDLHTLQWHWFGNRVHTQHDAAETLSDIAANTSSSHSSRPNADQLLASLQSVSDGWHGLSNGQLDTPWPKVRQRRQALQDFMSDWMRPAQPGTLKESSTETGTTQLHQALLQLLADRRTAADADLPATGVPLTMERMLSAAFIHSEEMAYGTRSTTALTVDRYGNVCLTERTFFPQTVVNQPELAWQDRSEQFCLQQ
ncbi:NRDE family protein [Ampullimonas aquatilis]|uniref:NRDE family protein n=1 Tax=Ampullimonas aquatilis TaxID=1341549 RepID=UPI003C73B0D9